MSYYFDSFYGTAISSIVSVTSVLFLYCFVVCYVEQCSCWWKKIKEKAVSGFNFAIKTNNK